jgi:NitT/TauT family transport system permease protein
VRRTLEILAPIALVALLLAAWEGACRGLAIAPYVLPPPSAVAASLAADAPSLLASAWNTLAMALIALAVASVLAQALALTVALSPILERAVRPLAVVLQVTPVVAVAPLVVIWAGIDHPQRAIVALAAVVAFFPIFSGVSAGLAAADPDLERLFRIYSASRWQTVTRLRLPSALPFILEGHKVAAGLAIIGAVVAEFVAGSGGAQGLAWRILEAGNRLKTAEMFAAIVVLAVMAAGLNALFAAGERSALRWWRGR